MLQTVLAFLGTVFTSLLTGLIQRVKSDAALKDQAVTDASKTTQQIIVETADARSQIRDSDSAADLARRMREAAAGSA